jgi:hypothetical protein
MHGTVFEVIQPTTKGKRMKYEDYDGPKYTSHSKDLGGWLCVLGANKECTNGKLMGIEQCGIGNTVEEAFKRAHRKIKDALKD